MCSQVALTALAVTLLCAGSARAGTMYVYSCHTPNGKPVGTAGWMGPPSALLARSSNDCATGPQGSLSATAGGNPFNQHAWWSFVAAPGTSITGFSTHVCTRGQRSLAWITWPEPGEINYSSGAPIWKNQVLGSAPEMVCAGAPPYWSDARNLVERHGFASSQLHFVAGCVTTCQPNQAWASIGIASFRADIRDDVAPVVSAVRGPLVSTARHVGVESVEFDVSDAGVGVYRAVAEARILGQGSWVEVGAATIGAASASCLETDVSAHRYEFDHPLPCPVQLTAARLDFDSGRLSPGEHQFRVLVEDAAGNRSDVIPPRSFTVAPPVGIAAPALGGPAERPVILRIADAARRSLPSAEQFRVRGSLSDSHGRPLSGIALNVRTRLFLPKPALPTGVWTDVGRAVTAADGTFNARVPAGASRTVQVARDAGGGFSAASAQIDVVVPARIAAKPRATRVRNGRSAVFTGRVAGPIPAGGVLVALEVREPGRWIPVATTRRWVRTTPAGRFKLAYRFRRTFEPSTYRFRVVAAEDSAFPYTRGVSRTIAVRVRP